METFWISFRIADKSVAGKSYDDRYNALAEAVNKHNNYAWDDSTSFWLVRSSSSREAIAKSLKAAIAPQVDLILIGSMDFGGAALVGKSNDIEGLKVLIPTLVIA